MLIIIIIIIIISISELGWHSPSRLLAVRKDQIRIIIRLGGIPITFQYIAFHETEIKEIVAMPAFWKPRNHYESRRGLRYESSEVDYFNNYTGQLLTSWLTASLKNPQNKKAKMKTFNWFPEAQTLQKSWRREGQGARIKIVEYI